MERVGADTGLSAPTLGLLGALPVLFFGVGSALVTRPHRRFGPDAVIAVALLAITAGLVLRSLPVIGALWVGSAVIGLGIAAGNVLAPAVIKREQPLRIPLVTAVFTAVMGVVAALASGVVVPVSDATGGGWRLPVAGFAVVSALVSVVWLRRARQARTVPLRAPLPAGRALPAEGRDRSEERRVGKGCGGRRVGGGAGRTTAG